MADDTKLADAARGGVGDACLIACNVQQSP
jgi:hypothetical protein